MKKICAPLATCISFSFFLSCQSGIGQSALLTAKDFRQMMERHPEAVVIDVRTPAEYAQGHLPDSKNIDFNASSFRDDIGKLDTSKIYLVYCRSGSRSAQAAKHMRQSGFRKVYELRGGILQWQKEGYGIEESHQTPK